MIRNYVLRFIRPGRAHQAWVSHWMRGARNAAITRPNQINVATLTLHESRWSGARRDFVRNNEIPGLPKRVSQKSVVFLKKHNQDNIAFEGDFQLQSAWSLSSCEQACEGNVRTSRVFSTNYRSNNRELRADNITIRATQVVVECSSLPMARDRW